MLAKKRKYKGSKYKRQFKEANIRAKYGSIRKPAPVTVRSMETGEVVGVYRQAVLTNQFPEENQDDWITERFAHLGFQSYGGYLRSQHWRNVKRRWIEAGRPQRCSVCGSAKYALHHKTYKRLGCESLDDLAPVCSGCHKAAHKLIGKRINGRRVMLENAVDVLAELELECDREIEKQFEETA